MDYSEGTSELKITNKSSITISIPKRQNVLDVDRESVITKLLEGHSLSTIASLYQINYQTVNSIYKRYLKTGLVFVGKKGGDRRSILTSE
ncbi:hypothetical protein H311_00855 [Anncaliia algerae PRA109]|nr:hypothetical protein H311_00855 [Anncaliia algerae PRA109]